MNWFSKTKGFDRSLRIFKFNYCPLAWDFTSTRSTKKKQIQYKKELFDCYIMTILAPTERYRTLALEIFKTLNVLNTTFIQDLFYLRFSFARRPNNIAVIRTNTNTYGTESLRSLGPHFWNSLSEHIKAETSLAHFRSLINTWFGKECLCNLCKHTRTLNSANY